MVGVVRCDHCGAPHRRESASTRFRCDWCGGDNRVEVRRLAEELVLAADDHSRDPATRVREALGRRGLAGAVLHPEPPRWVGVWQIVNEQGEEFVAPVRDADPVEPVIRALPAGRLQALGDEAPSWVSSLPSRPDPEGDSASVVDAARADFDDPEAPVTLVRLVWMGVAGFLVSVGDESFRVVQLLGTDRVLFERAPARPPRPAAVGERLAAWAVFVAGAILLGLVIDDSVARLAAVAAWSGVGLLLWLLRRDALRGVRA